MINYKKLGETLQKMGFGDPKAKFDDNTHWVDIQDAYTHAAYKGATSISHPVYEGDLPPAVLAVYNGEDVATNEPVSLSGKNKSQLIEQAILEGVTSAKDKDGIDTPISSELTVDQIKTAIEAKRSDK